MSLLKTITRTLLFSLIFLITANSLSYADGGFPVRPGRLLLAPAVAYVWAKSGWDQNSVKTPFADNGRF